MLTAHNVLYFLFTGANAYGYGGYGYGGAYGGAGYGYGGLFILICIDTKGHCLPS